MNALKSIPWRFYGTWLVPLCGILGVAMHGTQTYGWPVLFPVITREFGWSAAVAATASSLARFEGGFEAVVAGWVMDRYGPRITYIFGGLCMGIGWITLSFVTADNLLWYFIVFGVIVQTGGNVGGYMSGYKAINNWWIRRRARATAAFVLPVGLAGTLSPMIIAALVVSIGWRTTLVYMGIFCLVSFGGAGFFIRPHQPEYYGLLPDGDDPKAVKLDPAVAADKKAAEQALRQQTATKQTDLTTKEAIRTRSFWVYVISLIFYSFAFGGVTLFVPSHLLSRGYDLPTAAMFAGLMLSFSYVGRIAIIIFGDAVSPRILSIISWSTMAGGLLCLANVSATGAPYLAWGYVIIYGSAYGMSFVLVPVVKGWLFGRTNFASISGLMVTTSMIGSVTAPTFMGWTFDTQGSYWLGYTTLAGSYLIGCVCMAFLKRPTPKTVPSTAPSAA